MITRQSCRSKTIAAREAFSAHCVFKFPTANRLIVARRLVFETPPGPITVSALRNNCLRGLIEDLMGEDMLSALRHVAPDHATSVDDLWRALRIPVADTEPLCAPFWDRSVLLLYIPSQCWEVPEAVSLCQRHDLKAVEISSTLVDVSDSQWMDLGLQLASYVPLQGESLEEQSVKSARGVEILMRFLADHGAGEPESPSTKRTRTESCSPHPVVCAIRKWVGRCSANERNQAALAAWRALVLAEYLRPITDSTANDDDDDDTPMISDHRQRSVPEGLRSSPAMEGLTLLSGVAYAALSTEVQRRQWCEAVVQSVAATLTRSILSARGEGFLSLTALLSSPLPERVELIKSLLHRSDAELYEVLGGMERLHSWCSKNIVPLPRSVVAVLLAPLVEGVHEIAKTSSHKPRLLHRLLLFGRRLRQQSLAMFPPPLSRRSADAILLADVVSTEPFAPSTGDVPLATLQTNDCVAAVLFERNVAKDPVAAGLTAQHIIASVAWTPRDVAERLRDRST